MRRDRISSATQVTPQAARINLFARVTNPSSFSSHFSLRFDENFILLRIVELLDTKNHFFHLLLNFGIILVWIYATLYISLPIFKARIRSYFSPYIYNKLFDIYNKLFLDRHLYCTLALGWVFVL